MPPENESVEDFATAFDRAMAEDDTPAETEAREAETEAQVTADAVVAAETPQEPEVTAQEPEVTAPEVVPEVPATVSDVDYKAEVERYKAELEALKTAPPAKQEATPEPEHRAPEVPTVDALLSAEEKEVLTAYEDEWPDVSKAEALRRKVDLAIMKDEIYREVAGALESVLGKINPVLDNVYHSEEEKHNAAIAAAHPDYLDVLKNIDAWVAKQPAYLKTAMNTVLDSGSADEVNDLFSRFKEQNGRAAPQVPPATTATPKPVDEAKVQALTAVTAGRKQDVSTTVDANDFDGAWKRAANSN